ARPRGRGYTPRRDGRARAAARPIGTGSSWTLDRTSCSVESFSRRKAGDGTPWSRLAGRGTRHFFLTKLLHLLGTISSFTVGKGARAVTSPRSRKRQKAY